MLYPSVYTSELFIFLVIFISEKILWLSTFVSSKKLFSCHVYYRKLFKKSYNYHLGVQNTVNMSMCVREKEKEWEWGDEPPRPEVLASCILTGILVILQMSVLPM